MMVLISLFGNGCETNCELEPIGGSYYIKHCVVHRLFGFIPGDPGPGHFSNHLIFKDGTTETEIVVNYGSSAGWVWNHFAYRVYGENLLYVMNFPEKSTRDEHLYVFSPHSGHHLLLTNYQTFCEVVVDDDGMVGYPWSSDGYTTDYDHPSAFSAKFLANYDVMANAETPQAVETNTISLGTPPKPSLELITTLAGHTGSVMGVSFASDGKTLASGSLDKTVRIWDTERGVVKQTLEHERGVRSLAFSPDGALLATGTYEWHAIIWDANTWIVKNMNMLEPANLPVLALAFSGDGKTLVTANNSIDVHIWDLGKGTELRKVIVGDHKLLSVAYSPDGQMLATGSADRMVKLWDANTGALRFIMVGHSGVVTSVAFSPHGDLLASGSLDGTVKLWDVQTGHLRHTLTGLGEPIRAVAFSPLADIVAAGGGLYLKPGKICVWDLQGEQSEQILSGHEQEVTAICFSKDGKTLASGSTDKTVKLWRIK